MGKTIVNNWRCWATGIALLSFVVLCPIAAIAQTDRTRSVGQVQQERVSPASSTKTKSRIEIETETKIKTETKTRLRREKKPRTAPTAKLKISQPDAAPSYFIVTIYHQEQRQMEQFLLNEPIPLSEGATLQPRNGQVQLVVPKGIRLNLDGRLVRAETIPLPLGHRRIIVDGQTYEIFLQKWEPESSLVYE